MNRKLNSKKYTKIFFSIFGIFIFYHIVVWNLYTTQIFNRSDNLYIGDIGRLSYQVDSLYPRKLEYTLEKRHIHFDNWKGQDIDLITIGDSFSAADTCGKNPYYQDYIADRWNINVLNLKRYRDDLNSFDVILHLFNTGWLEKYKPKAILIQSVQRATIDRFSKEFNFSINNLELNYLAEKLKKENTHIPTLLPINSANFKLPFYNIKYEYNNNAYKNVIKLKLNDEFFTNKNYEDSLLFLKEDMTNINNDFARYELINDNFNRLAKMLKKLDIELIFMPVVDKYNLYYSYIKNKEQFPKSNFFNNFRRLDKEYHFLDTKSRLLPLLDAKKKDLYYPDDTHWSFNASNVISDDEIFSKIYKK